MTITTKEREGMQPGIFGLPLNDKETMKTIFCILMLAALAAGQSFRSHDREPSQAGRIDAPKRGVLRTPKLPPAVREVANCDLGQTSRGAEPAWLKAQKRREAKECARLRRRGF